MIFLFQEYLPFHSPEHLDVVFSEDRRTIQASRFLIQAKDIRKTFENKNLMESVQNLLKDFKYGKVFAFNKFFPFFEGVSVVLVFKELPIFPLWLWFNTEKSLKKSLKTILVYSKILTQSTFPQTV